MIKKSQIAKKNLKKSLSFAGGIGFFTIGGGLAVSIPIYYKIKDELNKKAKKLEDISSYISELTNKLGISPDEDFVKDLQGGYELVYTNGEVKIYKKKEGEDGTLVINVNPDGTVGSAATLEGPAAKAITEIIDSAANSLEKEGDAMKSILKPFIDEVEDKSISIESAITGMTDEEIRARNAWATKNAEEAKKRYKELQDKIKNAKDAAEKEASALGPQAQIDIFYKQTLKSFEFFKKYNIVIQNQDYKDKDKKNEYSKYFSEEQLKTLNSYNIFTLNNAQSLKSIFTNLSQKNNGVATAKDISDAAYNVRIYGLNNLGKTEADKARDKLKKDMIEFAKNKEEILKKKREELAKQIATAQAKLKETFKEGILKFYHSYTKDNNGTRTSKIKVDNLDLSEIQKKDINSFINFSKTKDVENYIDSLSTDEARNLFESSKSSIIIIDTLIKAQIEKDKKEQEAALKNKDILIKIASSLDSFANAIVRSYGYSNPNDPNEKSITPSQTLRNKLESKAKEVGINDFAIQQIEDYIKKSLGINSKNKVPSKRLKFSIELNTFNEADPKISQLVTLKAVVTEYTNGQINQNKNYVLGKSGTDSYLNLQEIIFTDQINNNKNYLNTMNYLIELSKKDFIINLRNKALESLLKEVQKPNSLSLITGTNKSIFNNVIKLIQKSQYLKNSIDFENQAMGKNQESVALDLLNQYLFESKPINFDYNELILAFKNAYLFDKLSQKEIVMDLLKDFLIKEPYDKTNSINQFNNVINVLGGSNSVLKNLKLNNDSLKNLLLGKSLNQNIWTNIFNEIFTKGTSTEISNSKEILGRYLSIDTNTSKQIIDKLLTFNNYQDIHNNFTKYEETKKYNQLWKWLDRNNIFAIKTITDNRAQEIFKHAMDFIDLLNNHHYSNKSINEIFAKDDWIKKILMQEHILNTQSNLNKASDIIKLTSFKDTLESDNIFKYDWQKLIDIFNIIDLNVLNDNLVSIKKEENNFSNDNSYTLKELLLKQKQSIDYQLEFLINIINKKSSLDIIDPFVFQITENLEDLINFLNLKAQLVANVTNKNNIQKRHKEIIENLENSIILKELSPVGYYNQYINYVKFLYEPSDLSDPSQKILSNLQNINKASYEDVKRFNLIINQFKSYLKNTNKSTFTTDSIKSFFVAYNSINENYYSNNEDSLKINHFNVDNNEWIINKSSNDNKTYSLYKSIDDLSGFMWEEMTLKGGGLNDLNNVDLDNMIIPKGKSKDFVFIGDKNDKSHVFAINTLDGTVTRTRLTAQTTSTRDLISLYVNDKSLYFYKNNESTPNVSWYSIFDYNSDMSWQKIMGSSFAKNKIFELNYQTQIPKINIFELDKNNGQGNSEFFSLSWIDKTNGQSKYKLAITQKDGTTNPWNLIGNIKDSNNKLTKTINLYSDNNSSEPLDIIFGKMHTTSTANIKIKDFYTLSETGEVRKYKLQIDTTNKEIKFLDDDSNKSVLISQNINGKYLKKNQLRPLFIDDKLIFVNNSDPRYYYDEESSKENLGIFNKLLK